MPRISSPGCSAVLFLLALAVPLLAPRPAEAEVEWDRASLRQVYAPAGDFYCYAPSLLRESGHDLVFACQNTTAGIIRDSLISLSRDTDPPTTRVLLSGNPGECWDDFHVCDPSALAGDFRLQGTRYPCALFYLGNNADACINNQIGAALAPDWKGPWHRLSAPLVAFPPNGCWGIGQPSALLDDKGRLLLFYTQGIPHTGGYFREVDLHDADHPRTGPAVPLSTAGLLNLKGRSDYWNNFDVAYDPWRRRFWAVRECHPYPKDSPAQISTHVELLSLPADQLFDPRAAWQVEGLLSPEITGHPRNHNACLERTPTGALPSPDRLRLLFSTSRTADQTSGTLPLWTYALWEITARLPAVHQPVRP